MEFDVDGLVVVPALAREDLVVECSYVVEFLLDVIERADQDGVVADAWDEFGITIFANMNLHHFGRPEVIVFEEECKVVEGLDVTWLDEAGDKGQLDGCTELCRHHGSITIDIEIDHGVAIDSIDGHSTFDADNRVTLLDIDAKHAIGSMIARSMTHQTILLLDVSGKLESVDLSVGLALTVESRLIAQQLTNAGLGDEMGIVARIIDRDSHATIAGLGAPEAIEMTGSQQVAQKEEDA